MPKAKKKKSKKVPKKPTHAKKTAKASKDAPKPKKADLSACNAQAGTGEPRDTRAKRPSGLDAAAQVLGQVGKPMSCKAIVERMLAQGLWQTKGKTPSATIYAAIIRHIAAKGQASRFRKTGRGKFALTK